MSARSIWGIISNPAINEAVFVVLCLRVRFSVSKPVQLYEHPFWPKSMIKLYGKPHLVWQYSWQRLADLIKFCLQTATLLSVLAIGLKNIWRLAGTSTSWLSMSVILCVVGYDSRSKSIMAMSLHMNLHALLMIWIFPSLCSRLAWCSRKMLLVPSLRQSTSPLLWCVVKYKVSWYFSLSFIFSHFLE